MENSGTHRCLECANVGVEDGNDGHFYCTQCGAQANFIDTGVDDDDLFDQTGTGWGGGLYSSRYIRHTPAVKQEPISQPQLDDDPFTQTPAAKQEEDEEEGFLSDWRKIEEDYLEWIRLRYFMGLQRMIQLQCEALVTEFKVNPLICGLAGTIWLRFLAGTQVFKRDAADLKESEQAEPVLKRSSKSRAQPGARYDPRTVSEWFWYLRKSIPLSYTLAVSFLACHLAREAVLPTDIVKWSLEGKLPYFVAFNQIENDLKNFGQPSRACPLSARLMFRPSESVPVQKLEPLAASVALSIGLDVPPVNFYAIASRFLNKLSLPVEKILPYACQIYEWSMPPDLWLSTNELRLPTRVCVMSILIVAVRILYNIHGFGDWERSLASRHASSSTTKNSKDLNARSSSKMRDDADKDSGDDADKDSDASDKNFVRNFSGAHYSKLDTAELLTNLEARYNELADDSDYCKDLPTYLQFCKDKVFARSESSSRDAKESLVESLWNFYQSEKDADAAVEEGLHCGRTGDQKRPSYNEECTSSSPSRENKFRRPSSDDETSLTNDHKRNQNDQELANTSKDEAITQLKLDMEEKRFCYIPPRVDLKRFDYLHYVRKKDEGAYTYAAHADYYILLRAFSTVAQVETRCMHIGVLSFERRLAWLEKRIDRCLHLIPPIVSCDYCTDKAPEKTSDVDTTGEESTPDKGS